MTKRENHKSMILTCPRYRPLSLVPSSKIKLDQIDRRPSWLMHNYPSGDPTPSQADIQVTNAIVDIAKPLGIAVHDHIIVGKSGHASLRGLKLI
jgi:hypothetical protein